MKPVTIYTKTTCPFCIRAKHLLDSKEVTYEEIIVSSPETRTEMIGRSSGGTTVPQIFIGEQHVGGCDDLFMLEHQGKLDGILA